MKIKNVFLFVVLCLTAFSALRAADKKWNDPTATGTVFFENSLEKGELQPVTIVLHQSNDGARVTIPNGAIVKVILKTQVASTGFNWTPIYSSSDVLAFQNRYIRKIPSYIVGVPVYESWIFKAVTSGQTLLTFSLARSWEKNVAPIQTVQFDITVE